MIFPLGRKENSHIVLDASYKFGNTLIQHLATDIGDTLFANVYLYNNFSIVFFFFRDLNHTNEDTVRDHVKLEKEIRKKFHWSLDFISKLGVF